MSLPLDVSACASPVTHLKICQECARNILNTKQANKIRLWSSFAPEKIQGVIGPVCSGYKEK